MWKIGGDLPKGVIPNRVRAVVDGIYLTMLTSFLAGFLGFPLHFIYHQARNVTKKKKKNKKYSFRDRLLNKHPF